MAPPAKVPVKMLAILLLCHIDTLALAFNQSSVVLRIYRSKGGYLALDFNGKGTCIPTRFYVVKGYVVRKTNSVGDEMVFGSFCEDTDAGRTKAEARRDKLQAWNDDEQQKM